MSTIDWLILLAYMVGVVWIGVRHTRQSSHSLDDYFLGGKKCKWWMLAASGASGNFDVAGTMLLVSIFYVLGLKAFWMFWSWQFFAGAFLMSYMAVWIRRTRVMTAVELMSIRFGNDTGGRTARSAAGILTVAFMVFSIGYGFVGLAKFLPSVLPQSLVNQANPLATGQIWALAIIVLTTIYVVAGGFEGVVITDVIQMVLMTVAGILVGVIAYFKLDAAAITNLHQQFSTSLLPVAKLDLQGNYAKFNDFGVLCLFWFSMGLMFNMSGAGGNYQEQRFLATRTHKDAAKTGWAWGFFLIPRYAMVAGFVCITATGMIGTKDPEQILPVMLMQKMPAGLLGLILAGLLAAFMSTFSATVNVTSSMIVRDLIQPACPHFSEKTLVRWSYISTVLVVAVGLVIGFMADSIGGIWSWMMAGLVGGSLIPNLLRWHWWRMNGWGYAAGILGGMVAAGVIVLLPYIKVLDQAPPEHHYAPIIWIVTLVGCVFGSLLTKPESDDVLKTFYSRVRPLGFWGPVRSKIVNLPVLNSPDQSPLRVFVNVILGITCLLTTWVSVFFVIGHFWDKAIITISLAVVTGGILFVTWYQRLKHFEAEDADQ